MLRSLPSFLFLCLLLLATACGKDEPEPQQGLVGRWKLEKSYARIYNIKDSLVGEGFTNLTGISEEITFTNTDFVLPTTFLGADNRCGYFSTQPYTLQDSTITWHTSGLYRPLNIAKLKGDTLELQITTSFGLPPNVSKNTVLGGQYLRQ